MGLSLLWLDYSNYFKLFVAIVKGVLFLISFSVCLVFVYKKATDFFLDALVHSYINEGVSQL